MIDPGQLRERVTFQRETRAPDGMGGFKVTWPDAFVRSAKVEAVRAREPVDAGRVVAQEVYLVTVRYDSQTRTLTAADRAVWNGRTMNMGPVQDREGKRALLTFEATVGVAQ